MGCSKIRAELFLAWALPKIGGSKNNDVPTRQSNDVPQKEEPFFVVCGNRPCWNRWFFPVLSIIPAGSSWLMCIPSSGLMIYQHLSGKGHDTAVVRRWLQPKWLWYLGCDKQDSFASFQLCLRAFHFMNGRATVNFAQNREYCNEPLEIMLYTISYVNRFFNILYKHGVLIPACGAVCATSRIGCLRNQLKNQNMFRVAPSYQYVLQAEVSRCLITFAIQMVHRMRRGGFTSCAWKPPVCQEIWATPASTEISFGGIPNSSSIDILMPYAIFDYMGAFLRSSFAHVDNVIPVNKTITWLLLSRLQGNKPHRNSPEPSEPPEPTPTRAGTLWNPPEPSELRLRNLHQHAPELSRTLWNLPRPSRTNLSEPSGTYLLNLDMHTPEPSEIFRNLHQHTPEPSKIFRNLPPEPTPAHAGTLRNLPSGTFLRNLLLRPAPAHTGAYLGWRPH